MTKSLGESDILIIGAGLVGVSQAVSLNHQNLSIRVLENHLPHVVMESAKDKRPITLSYASVRILQQLGVWDCLSDDVCPIHAVHVSHQGAFGAIRFRASEMGVPALGYVLAFSDLQKALYQRLMQQENVMLTPINTITDMVCDANGAVVKANTAEGEQCYRAALLIAADGTESPTRKRLGISAVEHDANEVALTAYVELTIPHDSVAYERFTKQGTLALLPLPERKNYRLVWTMPAAQVDDVKSWDALVLKEKIQAYFRGYVNGIQSVSIEKSFPLKTVLAEEQIRPGCVLLGNAAHTLYPVAAQGFNLGLRDVAVLSEVLVEASKRMERLGDERVLRQYAQWRLPDQQRVATITQGMTHLFGLDLPFMTRLRGMGLLAAELFSPIKKRLARRLMGVAGRLPKLARGLSIE